MAEQGPQGRSPGLKAQTPFPPGLWTHQEEVRCELTQGGGHLRGQDGGHFQQVLSKGLRVAGRELRDLDAGLRRSL